MGSGLKLNRTRISNFKALPIPSPRSDRPNIPAQPIAKQELVPREIGYIITMVKNERLDVDARNEPFTRRKQFLELPPHEILRQPGDILAVRVGDAPRDGVERRPTQCPYRPRGVNFFYPHTKNKISR